MFSGGTDCCNGANASFNQANFERDIARAVSDGSPLTAGECLQATVDNGLESNTLMCKIIADSFSRGERFYHTFKITGTDQTFRYKFDRAAMAEDQKPSMLEEALEKAYLAFDDGASYLAGQLKNNMSVIFPSLMGAFALSGFSAITGIGPSRIIGAPYFIPKAVVDLYRSFRNEMREELAGIGWKQITETIGNHFQTMIDTGFTPALKADFRNSLSSCRKTMRLLYNQGVSLFIDSPGKAAVIHNSGFYQYSYVIAVNNLLFDLAALNTPKEFDISVVLSNVRKISVEDFSSLLSVRGDLAKFVSRLFQMKYILSPRLINLLQADYGHRPNSQNDDSAWRSKVTPLLNLLPRPVAEELRKNMADGTVFTAALRRLYDFGPHSMGPLMQTSLKRFGELGIDPDNLTVLGRWFSPDMERPAAAVVAGAGNSVQLSREEMLRAYEALPSFFQNKLSDKDRESAQSILRAYRRYGNSFVNIERFGGGVIFDLGILKYVVRP